MNNETIKTLTAEAYAEGFSQVQDFDDYLQDAHWQQNYSTDKCYEWMLRAAKADGIELTGLDDFDYDTFFYDVYRYTEKGLS